MVQHSRYHKFLRTSLLVFATVLIFDGGFVVPISKQLSDQTIVYLANSIGVTASIETNELNVITAELTRRTQELDARERELAEREIARRNFDTESADLSIYFLSIILFILTLLIVLNYALDWMRVRKVGGMRTT